MSQFQEVVARVGASTEASGSTRDYLVTVFKALKSGALYALVLRVGVAQTIDWVRAHVDEIAAKGIQTDDVAKNPDLPIVALNVEPA